MISVEEGVEAQARLLKAVGLGDLAEIQRLVRQGANLDQGDEGGWTPLHYAVVQRQLRAVEALLELGANATVADLSGFNAEHYAALLGDNQILQAVRG